MIKDGALDLMADLKQPSDVLILMGSLLDDASVPLLVCLETSYSLSHMHDWLPYGGLFAKLACFTQ